jgi:hypothetical protein
MNVMEGVTHIDPHVDDIVGLSLYGWLTETELVLSFLSDEEIAALPPSDHRVVVGAAHGKYDDHTPEGRRPNTCATSLVVEDLGLSDVPALQTLLWETLRSDTHQKYPGAPDNEKEGQKHMEWGQVVKHLHAFGDRGINNLAVFQFVDAIVKAHLTEVCRTVPARIQEPISAPLSFTEATPGKEPMISKILMPMYVGVNTHFAVWFLLTLGDILYTFKDDVPPQVIFIEDQLSLFNYLEDLRQTEGSDGEDILYVGMEGGQFPASMSARKVLAKFGIVEDKKNDDFEAFRLMVGEIDEYTERNKPFDFGRVVSLLNLYGEFLRPKEDGGMEDMAYEAIHQITLKVFEAYSDSAAQFNHFCPKEFREKGRYEDIWVGSRKMRFAAVTTEYWKMPAYLRKRLHADVVLIRQEIGTAQFFSNEEPDLENKEVMHFIGREIVEAECYFHGLSWEDTQRQVRAYIADVRRKREKTLPAPAGHWYNFLPGGHLFNASRTHKQPPTNLSDDVLWECGYKGIENYLIARSHGRKIWDREA